MKHLIWLFQKENWRRHWKAIVTAGILFGAGWVISVYLREQVYQPTESEPEVASESEINLLDPEEIRWSIDQAIKNSDLDSAIKTLSALVDSELRREECQRVFDHTIQKKEHNHASNIVDACWKGEEQQAKRAEIERERIKR